MYKSNLEEIVLRWFVAVACWENLKSMCYLRETEKRSDSISKYSPGCVQTLRLIRWRRKKEDVTFEEPGPHSAVDSAVW